MRIYVAFIYFYFTAKYFVQLKLLNFYYYYMNDANYFVFICVYVFCFLLLLFLTVHLILGQLSIHMNKLRIELRSIFITIT
jgi:hypothetical protein